MVEKTEMTEQRWLEDFENWSLGTENSDTTKRIYDALKESGKFEINYSKSDFQSRAHFLIPWMHPNFELIRATIHVDNPTKKKEEAWLNKDRAEKEDKKKRKRGKEEDVCDKSWRDFDCKSSLRVARFWSMRYPCW